MPWLGNKDGWSNIWQLIKSFTSRCKSVFLCLIYCKYSISRRLIFRNNEISLEFRRRKHIEIKPIINLIKPVLEKIIPKIKQNHNTKEPYWYKTFGTKRMVAAHKEVDWHYKLLTLHPTRSHESCTNPLMEVTDFRV